MKSTVKELKKEIKKLKNEIEDWIADRENIRNQWRASITQGNELKEKLQSQQRNISFGEGQLDELHKTVVGLNSEIRVYRELLDLPERD